MVNKKDVDLNPDDYRVEEEEDDKEKERGGKEKKKKSSAFVSGFKAEWGMGAALKRLGGSIARWTRRVIYLVLLVAVLVVGLKSCGPSTPTQLVTGPSVPPVTSFPSTPSGPAPAITDVERSELETLRRMVEQLQKENQQLREQLEAVESKEPTPWEQRKPAEELPPLPRDPDP